jgi:hypothetical protein
MEFIAINSSPYYNYPIFCNKDNIEIILDYYNKNKYINL